jgi:hypothetical protein
MKMLKSTVVAIALSLSGVVVTGCASKAELVGTATGAAVGAAVGGGTLATVAGGVVGYQAGKKYDEKNR